MKTSIYFLLLFVAATSLSCTKTTETDDDLVGNWIRSWDFEGKARTEGVSTVTADGKVYLGLGYDGTSRLTDFWEYDYTTDVWNSVTRFPGTARSSAIAFSAANKVYVGLGYDGTNYLNDLWAYDPQTQTWDSMAAFPMTGRSGAVAFAINDKGYVSSGYDGSYQKDFWKYDPVDNSWQKMTSPAGFKRNESVAFVIDNKAYLCTGVNNGEYVNDLYVYDPALDTWEKKREIVNYDSDLEFDDDYTTITRSNAVAFTLNGKGYITTGINGGYRTATWEYDPGTDLWLEKTAFEGTAREGAIAFVVNNRAFVGLGNSANLRFDNFFEFMPSSEYDEND